MSGIEMCSLAKIIKGDLAKQVNREREREREREAETKV